MVEGLEGMLEGGKKRDGRRARMMETRILWTTTGLSPLYCYLLHVNVHLNYKVHLN